jgi:hypothetical protein
MTLITGGVKEIMGYAIFWSVSYLNKDLRLKCVILGEIINTRLQEEVEGRWVFRQQLNCS